MERPRLRNLPAFVAIHGGRGHAGEGVDFSHGFGVEPFGRRSPDVLDRQALQAQIRPIEAGPHFGAEAVANVPGVLPPGRHTTPHRVGIGRLEGQVVGQRVGVRQAVVVLGEKLDISDRRLTVEAAVDAQPAEVKLLNRPVDQGFGLQAQETTEVLSSLQVAAQPVETLGAARQHAA